MMALSGKRLIASCTSVIFFLCLMQSSAYTVEPQLPPPSFAKLASQFCSDCHSGPDAEARLDLDQLVSQPIANHLFRWRQITRLLAEGSMPPRDAEQPPLDLRQSSAHELRKAFQSAIEEVADDPGPILIRRLTNAEYEYCVEDLTGLSFDLQNKMVSDGVGGSGFTNAATSQFVQDTTLERYLEVAKQVAEHAMIGSGPLYFYDAPRNTGLELSAADRIRQIYREHGFRAAAGEGAAPFGLEKFERAFLLAWRYRYRSELGQDDATLDSLAKEANLAPKFAHHIWEVLTSENARFPLSKIVGRWNQFPQPSAIDVEIDERIELEAKELFELLQTWQNRFAASASAEEEAALLTGDKLELPAAASFIARASLQIRQSDAGDFTPDLNNPAIFESGDRTLRFTIAVEAASEEMGESAVVIFQQPEFRARVTGNLGAIQPDPVALASMLSAEDAASLAFGKNPGGEPIGAHEFVMKAGETKELSIELPQGSRVGELLVDVRLDRALGQDSVVRCIITDTSGQRGRQYSSLLRDPKSSIVEDWLAGVAEFATALPQISHREPAPSDRDPIPEPYDNGYNVPERNHFHKAVKYFRKDDFFITKIVPNEDRERLEQAWTDLLTSFDYHNLNLKFAAGKFNVDLGGHSIATLTDDWLRSLPEPARSYIAQYKSEYDAMQGVLAAAERRHVEDLLAFAARAWRRELDGDEQTSLVTFYESVRRQYELTHEAAIRATLVRVLVSPEFIYRIEQPGEEGLARPLSQAELASRLSFSIWASMPDEDLMSLARQGELLHEKQLEAQVRRMLSSPKTRRLANEFFGQWFGFYQFDAFRGVDANKFPEFDERLKRALYDEAITFFEHIVREDRPYTEILHADYSFVDEITAAHYGMAWNEADGRGMRLKTAEVDSPRGGLLGLAAVLTTTSAPLRTSPVKRGDWILRRILGTPVPPPPADAGSIPADDVLTDGLTVPERLALHRTREECNSCHVRIDPLGFALENFDSLGRWRETYADGREIVASSELPSGEVVDSVAGLKRYLMQHDQDFRRMLASRLVGYMLGRAEMAYDAALIERIVENLEADPRFSTAVLTVIKSPQFSRIRSGKQTESLESTALRKLP